MSSSRVVPKVIPVLINIIDPKFNKKIHRFNLPRVDKLARAPVANDFEEIAHVNGSIAIDICIGI
jgi:hypothetical protein